MINFLAVDFHDSVSNTHEQLALYDTLEIDPVSVARARNADSWSHCTYLAACMMPQVGDLSL